MKYGMLTLIHAKMEEVKILIKLKEPVNRDEKRKFEKELNWLNNWYYEIIIPLEKDFWEQLKIAGLDIQAFKLIEYQDIYDRYCDKFISARDKTNHTRLKFKFLDINMYYFDCQ